MLFERMDHEAVLTSADSTLHATGSPIEHQLVARWALCRRKRSQGDLNTAAQLLQDLMKEPGTTRSAMLRLLVTTEHARLLKSMMQLDLARTEAMKGRYFAQLMRRPQEEAEMLILLAEIDRRAERFPESLRGLNEAEEVLRSVPGSSSICNILIDKANIHYDQGRDDEALRGYKEALSCANRFEDVEVAMNAAYNVAALIGYLGSVEQAIAYYDSLLAVELVRRHPALLADIHTNLGTLANDHNDHGRAVRELLAAERIQAALHDSEHVVNVHLFLSRSYLGLGQPDSARSRADRALRVSRSLGSKDLEAEAELRLAEVFDAFGQCDSARAHVKRGYKLRLELSEIRNDQRMSLLEVEFETEKKERELALTNAELAMSKEEEHSRKQQRNAVIIVALLLTGLAILLFRNYRNQRRLRAQENTLHTRAVNDILKQQEINSLEAMMKGQERERERVGRDLHDRIGSMLSSVKLQFSALEGRLTKLEDTQRTQYDKLSGLLDETVAEVRRISHDMVRGTLADFGLLRALQDLGEALTAPGKLNVEMSAFGMEDRLPPPFEVGVYRIVQECVSNVLRHAKATELTIQLTRSAYALNVLVEDNGRGFDPHAMTAGLGLSNIKERAAALGGTTSIDSALGRGTTVSIDLPLA